MCCPLEVEERCRRARIARGCDGFRESNLELEVVGTDCDSSELENDSSEVPFPSNEAMEHKDDLKTVGASSGKLRKTFEPCLAKDSHEGPRLTAVQSFPCPPFLPSPLGRTEGATGGHRLSPRVIPPRVVSFHNSLSNASRAGSGTTGSASDVVEVGGSTSSTTKPGSQQSWPRWKSGALSAGDGIAS